MLFPKGKKLSKLYFPPNFWTYEQKITTNNMKNFRIHSRLGLVQLLQVIRRWEKDHSKWFWPLKDILFKHAMNVLPEPIYLVGCQSLPFFRKFLFPRRRWKLLVFEPFEASCQRLPTWNRAKSKELERSVWKILRGHFGDCDHGLLTWMLASRRVACCSVKTAYSKLFTSWRQSDWP